MLQAELKILGGKHQGKLISLNTKKFLVGREQDCHLRPNSDLVSRHHCVFTIDEYAVRLRDLGSTNGTLLNGTNLRGEVLLKSGDRITIGKLELEVVIRQATGKTPVPPTIVPKTTEQASSILSTAEIATQTAMPEPVYEEQDTSYEVLTPAAVAAAMPVPVSSIPADTAILTTNPSQYPPQMAPGYPANYPQMMPSGYPMPGGYMPPQYPQYPPGYGQPGGYGQPMGYPMGYPQMMPMQQPYPGVAVAAPVAAPAAAPEVQEAAKPAEMAVRLPDPSETGVKPAAPPAAAAATPGAAPAKKEEKPSTSAADIIKQYMSRRS